MSEQNLQTIKKLWVGFAAYYQSALSDFQVQMYAEDCETHNAEEIGAVMKAWRGNPKHNRLPLPGQLLEMLEGGSAKNNSNVLVTKMIAAVKAHDKNWCHRLPKTNYIGGSFEAEFLHELGAEAMHVVKLHGGWGNFCDAYWNSGNETSFKAQIRDLCEGVIEQQKLGTLLPFTSVNLLGHEPQPQTSGPNKQQLALLLDEAKEKCNPQLVERIESLIRQAGGA